jgi:hypothetical protein
MNWQNIINKFKNTTVQYGLQYYLRRYIKRMLELSIDNKNKKIHLMVELKGEEKPISIDIQYEVNVDDKKDRVRVKANSISISKEWINLIAQEVIGKEFSFQGKDSARLFQLIKQIGII